MGSLVVYENDPAMIIQTNAVDKSAKLVVVRNDSSPVVVHLATEGQRHLPGVALSEKEDSVRFALANVALCTSCGPYCFQNRNFMRSPEDVRHDAQVYINCVEALARVEKQKLVYIKAGNKKDAVIQCAASRHELEEKIGAMQTGLRSTSMFCPRCGQSPFSSLVRGRCGERLKEKAKQ